MFLRRRLAQAEYLDSPRRSASELRTAYAALARVNRLCQFSHPFVSVLPRWLGVADCQSLQILDVGAGDGLLGRRLVPWANRRGWRWQCTNLDMNSCALSLDDGARRVLGTALALPFCDRSFDLVIASQMTHHFHHDEEVIQHFREAWRVTRDAVLFSDLHRNAAFYAALWGLVRLLRVPAETRSDALMSVRGGFRVGEWRTLAAAAGLNDARVWVYAGARIMLQARKSR
jgi:SAM-dependent methyltransferase